MKPKGEDVNFGGIEGIMLMWEAFTCAGYISPMILVIVKPCVASVTAE
jgi:hypothetical protein